MNYQFGVDLGGTNIAAGIVDSEYRIVHKASVPTEAQRPAEQIAASMAALCHQICKEFGIGVEDIDSVGIASPGICDHDTGVVVYTNNLPFHQFEICDLIKKDFPAKAFYIENDANAAAWGEAIAGAAKGTTNSVMITLGTGVGGGVIIDKHIFDRGVNAAVAELGHMVIHVGGRQCSCGRRGCWEAYSSATALIRMTTEKIAEYEEVFREESDQKAKDILSLAIPGLPTQNSINILQDSDICVSAGSACAKGHRSHVLTAMNLRPEVMDGSFRVSLCRDTTQEELDALANVIKNDILPRAR